MNRHTVSSLFLSVSLLLGCGTDQTRLETINPETTSLQKDNARRMFRIYVRAIVEKDTKTLQSVLSKDLLNRIQQKGPQEDFLNNLTIFAEREARKLANTLSGGVGAIDSSIAEEFEVTSVNTEIGEGIVAATVQFNGQELPRPFFFVHAGGELRASVQAPGNGTNAKQRTEWDSFKIKNTTTVARTVACEGGSRNVSGRSTAHVRCKNNCSWAFAGTNLWLENPNTGSVSCDWNWWGVDATIKMIDFIHPVTGENDPYPGIVCNDNC